MDFRVRCVDPNAHADNPRELADSDHVAAFGEVITVDGTLAARLIDQPAVWQLHEDDAAALAAALAAPASAAAAPAPAAAHAHRPARRAAKHTEEIQ